MKSSALNPTTSKPAPQTADFPWQADLGDGTYRNPVIYADYSDPDVVRVGGDFYLTASSFGHVPGLPIYHLYSIGPDAGTRPLHWDANEDAQRPVKWAEREKLSRQRLSDLVSGAPLGVYGLGRARTLAEYAAFSGIDYTRKSLAPQAYKPLASIAAPAPVPVWQFR